MAYYCAAGCYITVERATVTSQTSKSSRSAAVDPVRYMLI